MNKKDLFLRVVVTLCVMAIFNVAIYYTSRNKLSHAAINKLVRSPRIDTLFLGHSIVQSGAKPEAFRQEWEASGGKLEGIVYNAGIGGTSSVEHLLLLRAATRKHKQFGTIIYGFHDFLLTDSPDPSKLEGSRSMSFYLEPEVAAQYYARNWSERLPFLYTRHVPYLVERSLVWAKVEKLRRSISEIGIASREENNEFGRADDFKALEVEPAEFAARCTDIAENHKKLSPAAEALITQARQHADHVYIVLWPGSPYHRATYYDKPEWARYQEHIRQSVEQLGAEFVDASEWVPSEEYFSDHVHLASSSAGPALFSSHLAKELLSRRKTAPVSAPATTGQTH